MNVNVQGIRRNVKNVVRNYTDAQVREADWRKMKLQELLRYMYSQVKIFEEHLEECYSSNAFLVIQVKVREATSNDPWGPPSALMGEIADLSYNVVAFTEIMQIIWKRCKMLNFDPLQ